MQRQPELIDRSAEEGARVVALALLSDADEAARALERRGDEEALHDFRVGLRRLRSALRAFRPWLAQGVPRKHEKRLKRLARATNAAREAEVQLAWLAAERDALASRSRRPGLELLQRRLEARRREADRGHGSLMARYRRASARLRRRLAGYEVRLDDGAGHVPFSAAAAALLSEQLGVLSARIDAVRGPADAERTDRARIEAKRLRYLLEALRGSEALDPRPAAKHLEKLQDVLGDLHDHHVLATELAAALGEVSAERAHRLVAEEGGGAARALRDSPRPGLVAAARRVRERRDELHAALARDWVGAGLEAVAADVLALVAALERRAGGALEVRRRWLLSAVPPALADVAPRRLEEGWLPGVRLRERLRRERTPSGERFSRALAQGAGRWRLALEEEVSREVFDVLWLIAEERRSSTRWEVPEGGLTWSVEELPEGRGWFAEVRLPASVAQAPMPDWLAPIVEREITGEPLELVRVRHRPSQARVSLLGVGGLGAGNALPQ
jgi:CHAD domain-containing protein